MLITRINRKRLSASFIYNPTTYKEIRIGDLIRIPFYQCHNLDRSIVVVTGFNRDLDVILWRSPSIYPFGGLVHSGTYYDEIERHIRVYNGSDRRS